MLIPRSISLSIWFAALDWFRLARCRVLCAWPVRTLLRVAGPGITVVAKPARAPGARSDAGRARSAGRHAGIEDGRRRGLRDLDHWWSGIRATTLDARCLADV